MIEFIVWCLVAVAFAAALGVFVLVAWLALFVLAMRWERRWGWTDSVRPWYVKAACRIFERAHGNERAW